MMSVVVDQEAQRPSALDGLRVSIDAHTLDIAAGKRRLRAIEPDGSLTYEDQ